MEQIISIILLIALVYITIGFVFSLIFVWKGLSKVDPGTQEGGKLFKVLIFPGLVTFWPLFLAKWKKV